HMHAGPCGSFAIFPMQGVGQSNVNSVYFPAAQTLIVKMVSIRARNAILSAQLLELEFVARYQRNQFGILSGMGKRGQNSGLSNVAQADNCIADPSLAVHDSLRDQ